jgi:hypothetical protein
MNNKTKTAKFCVDIRTRDFGKLQKGTDHYFAQKTVELNVLKPDNRNDTCQFSFYLTESSLHLN